MKRRPFRSVVARHVYPENGASVTIYAVRDQPGVPKADTLEVRIVTEADDVIAFHLRPDEALLLIQLLAEAVDRSTGAYRFSVARKTKCRGGASS